MVISHSAIPKHLFDQVQYFLFVSVPIPKLLSQLWGTPSSILKLLLKIENSKKSKIQGMHFLDESFLSTIGLGHTVEYIFSLYNVGHWFYNILICYSRCVVPYAIMLEFYYIANTTTSMNQSCNHIKIYTELVWQDSSVNNYLLYLLPWNHY